MSSNSSNVDVVDFCPYCKTETNGYALCYKCFYVEGLCLTGPSCGTQVEWFGRKEDDEWVRRPFCDTCFCREKQCSKCGCKGVAGSSGIQLRYCASCIDKNRKDGTCLSEGCNEKAMKFPPVGGKYNPLCKKCHQKTPVVSKESGHTETSNSVVPKAPAVPTTKPTTTTTTTATSSSQQKPKSSSGVEPNVWMKVEGKKNVVVGESASESKKSKKKNKGKAKKTAEVNGTVATPQVPTMASTPVNQVGKFAESEVKELLHIALTRGGDIAKLKAEFQGFGFDEKGLLTTLKFAASCKSEFKNEFWVSLENCSEHELEFLLSCKKTYNACNPGKSIGDYIVLLQNINKLSNGIAIDQLAILLNDVKSKDWADNDESDEVIRQ